MVLVFAMGSMLCVLDFSLNKVFNQSLVLRNDL